VEKCYACQLRDREKQQRRDRILSNVTLILPVSASLGVAVGVGSWQMSINHFGLGAGAFAGGLVLTLGMLALLIEFWKKSS